MEKDADQSLIKNRIISQIETPVDEAQAALLFILQTFGISAERLYGLDRIDFLLDSMLSPLGIMYEPVDDVANHAAKKSEFILAFRDDDHAVALIPGKTGYRCYTPSDSTMKRADSWCFKSLKPSGYVIYRPFAEGKTVTDRFISSIFTAMSGSDILRLLAATGLIVLLGLAIPQINRWVYKDYIEKSTYSTSVLLTMMIIYLSVTLARAAFTFVKTTMLSETKVRVSMVVQSAFMAKVMNLPHSFFRNTSSGKTSRRLMSCVRLTDILMDVFMDVLLNMTFSIVYLFQLRFLSPELFTPALVFIGLKLLFSIISAVLDMINTAKQLNVDMDYMTFLNSALKGIQKVKSMGSETIIYSKWAEMYRKKLSLTYNQPFLLKYNSEIISAITLTTTGALLYSSCIHGLTGEDYLTFTSSLTLIMTVTQSIMDIMGNLFLTQSLCDNVAPIIRAEREDTQSATYLYSLKGNIRAESLCFSYDDGVGGRLRDISFSIRRGEKVAIVGESGCGKSTLLKLLIGMEKPDSGTVFFDDKPLSDLNQKSLRRCIGSVFQFSRVFPGTIADNVSFGSGGLATEKEIWEALDAAVIGDHIRSLPLQLDTEVSESVSSGFSGGQRQRLLLARAFLRKPRVLILDEATSALDNVTQKTVLENIRSMHATVVMVAHRLSTVKEFDRIIMMDKGCIIEEGTYEELMEQNGSFANLVRKQLTK